jgi:hypothetical protein
MSDEKVLTATKADIIGTRKAGKAIEEIFSVIHPAPVKAALGDIFTRESAAQFLTRVSDFSRLLSPTENHAAAMKRLDAEIARLEKLRDEVLAALYEQLRPVERSYRLLATFFENVDVRDTVQRPPVDFFIFNADTKAIKNDIDSSTILAVDEFVKSRNDTFNFRQFICNLVIPGYVPDRVRKRFEDISNAWGMLLIGDLKDEPNFRALSDQFRTDGGSYEFLKRPEDKAASDVVIAGYVKLRDQHWFEAPDDSSENADLYGPPSLVFAGCLARTDRTTGGGIAQGPVGMLFGKVRGVEKARIEPRISQMEHLTMDRQVVTIVRNADNDLCFTGSRTQAEDPNGVLKFFTSYRVLRYIERRIAVYLREVAEQRLTRDLVKDKVRDPIEEMLEEEKKKGTIYNFAFSWDPDEDKLAMGVLDMELEVLPVGPAETFQLKIDVPQRKKKEGA